MGDLGIGILKPGMGGGSPPSPGTPPPGQPPPGQPPQGAGLPQGVTPGQVQALRAAVQALREIPGMEDQDIIDLLMQAISVRGLEIAREDIEQMVQAVPPRGQGATAPPPGEVPPGMPPQGAPPQGMPPGIPAGGQPLM